MRYGENSAWDRGYNEAMKACMRTPPSKWDELQSKDRNPNVCRGFNAGIEQMKVRRQADLEADAKKEEVNEAPPVGEVVNEAPPSEVVEEAPPTDE